MEKKTHLLENFETLDTKEWLQNIEKYLKGKPLEQLNHVLSEELSIQPFYRKEDTLSIPVLPVLGNNQWKISETIVVDGHLKMNQAAILNALELGVNHLVLDAQVPVSTLLPELLQPVFLNMVEISLRGKGVEANPEACLKAMASCPKANETVLYLDLANWDSSQVVSLLQKYKSSFHKLSIGQVNLSIHAGEPASQLAEALKKAEQRLWDLLQAGFAKDQVVHYIVFQLEVGDDYFLSIASIRALKQLWMALANAYEFQLTSWPSIMVKTSLSPSSDDPYWNMIAATTQALSAAVAQVSAIEVLPVNTADKDFARRIARNVQHLLKMESHVDKVIDPASGSYYLENYSIKLAEKAWELFLSLKKE